MIVFQSILWNSVMPSDSLLTQTWVPLCSRGILLCDFRPVRTALYNMHQSSWAKHFLCCSLRDSQLPSFWQQNWMFCVIHWSHGCVHNRSARLVWRLSHHPPSYLLLFLMFHASAWYFEWVCLHVFLEKLFLIGAGQQWLQKFVRLESTWHRSIACFTIEISASKSPQRQQNMPT